MACPPSNIKFQLRRSTSYNWNSINPILQSGEPGFESDTYKLKIGDGIRAWNILPYISSAYGSIGSTGPTGPQGIKGSTGPTGLQGIQGSIGPMGLQGIQGITGSQGIQGSTGPTGPQGIQGSTGPITTYIFDGGNSLISYVLGPAFDCGTSN